MDIRDALDGFIEEAVVELYPPELSAELLLSEDFRIPGEEGDISLLEAMTRVKIRVAGGGYMTKRKFGRKDPRRSMIAKRSARKGRAARMRAMRNPRSKMKRKRTMAARNRMMGSSRRGAHGAKRHAAPRVRRPRAFVRRPKIRRPPRPKVRRPSFRRPKVRRPPRPRRR